MTCVALLAAVLCAVSAISGAQTPSDGVDWQVTGLSAADKQDILAVTRRLGFTPRRVVPWPVLAPPGCVPVLVETTFAVSGPRLSSKSISILKLAKKDWRLCRPSSSGAVTVGQWTAFRDEILDDIKWRIQEGDLTLDVRLGPNVAYEEARRIVLAIHRRTWTRSTPLDSRAPWSDPDSSRIQSITRDPRRGPDYQIGFSPSGATSEFWDVILSDSAVEIAAYHMVFY